MEELGAGVPAGGEGEASAQDQGIAMDAKTGVLAWKLDEETVKRLGESIEISFAVSDGDGGKTSGTVTLNLTKPK